MQQRDQDQEQKLILLLALVLVFNAATHLAPSSHRLRPTWSRNPEDRKRRWRLKKHETKEEDENEEKDEYKVSEAVEGKHDNKEEDDGNDKVNENDDDDWNEEDKGKENNIALNNPRDDENVFDICYVKSTQSKVMIWEVFFNNVS